MAGAAQTASERSSNALPKPGTDAAAIARTTAKWQQVQIRLSAGMPLHDIMSRADVETVHAIAEFGPSWAEAESFKAGAGRGSRGQGAPDHSALHRAVEERLSQLSGPDAVAALAESRAAAGEAAYVAVQGQRLDSLIAGTTPSSTMLSAALEAEHAEQLAVHGQAPEQAPATEATR